MRRTSNNSAHTSRAGFTMLELLAVISIIVVLTGMVLGGAMAWRRSAQRSATKTLIESVAHALETAGAPVVTETDGVVTRTWRRWDANADGLLDGDPSLDQAGLANPALLIASGYRGALGAIPEVPARFIAQDSRRIVDAWRRPLHIAWAAGSYGGAAFGLWSCGPDGLTGPLGSAEAKDDIRSWNVSE